LLSWEAAGEDWGQEARMRDLRGFREAVREHRRIVGRDQQQLARSIGLHPHVLSHKLNGRGSAVLTVPEVIGIATTLASWGALVARADVHALLELMDVPPRAIPDAAWSVPPLADLRADHDGAATSRAAPGLAPHPRAATSFAAPASLPGQSVSPALARLAAPPEAPAGRPQLAPAPLPAPVTALVGRTAERAAAAAAVAAARLVTLTGAGGTGKTRLALQVAGDLADRFADGVAFADLALVSDPALLGTAAAGALGLAPHSAQSAEAELAGALRDRELLLVLDNLEQLLEGTGLLARLLAAAAGLRLLVTSRIPLRLYGEQTLRVPPLRLPGDDPAIAAQDSEAVQLFINRARAVRPEFAPDAGQLAAVGKICTALDGLPLAIELAAARIRLYSPRALLPLLQSRLALLTDGPRDLPGRQQTLRATLDWSHDLLDPQARRLFARLGVFAGPFDATAAAAAGNRGEPRTLEQLADLADQGLLEATAGETPRFRMLQTVREYALACLAQTGEQDDARRRHLLHYLAVASDAHGGLEGLRQGELMDQLEAAYPNMQTALDFAGYQAERDGTCLDQGLRLATALGPFWTRRGPLAEGVLQMDRLLALDDARHRSSAPQIRASAMLAACTLAYMQGNYPRTTQLARQAIELCTPLSDHKGLIRAHLLLGEAAIAVGDQDAARAYFDRALAQASQGGNLARQADACNMMGEVFRHRGDFRRASAWLWRSVKFSRAVGDPDRIGVALGSLGEVARDAGRPVQARRLYGAGLRRHAALGNNRLIAYHLEGFAAAAGLEHDGRQALVFLGAAQALRDQTGGPLPPAEQAILTRILAPALAPLTVRERQEALSEGRSQPLPAIINRALRQLPLQGKAIGDRPDAAIRP
jgi:predicted ATPase